MAVSVTFRLKDPQVKVSPSKQDETMIIMFFSYGYFENSSQGKLIYKPLKYSTGLKIKPHFWNKENHRAKQVRQVDYDNINALLDKIENKSKEVYRKLLIDDIKPTPAELKYAINVECGLVKDIRTETLNEYIGRFILEAEEGTRLYFHNGKEGKYTHGTVKSYKTFQVQFKLYQKDRSVNIDFDGITLKWYEDFKTFLYEKDYTKNSVGKSIKHLKTIMRCSKDEGLHSNLEYTHRKFLVGKEQVYEVYLNEEEIDQLANCDLSNEPSWELARDLWMMCYYTAQSIVDVKNLSLSNVIKLKNGTKALSFSRQKTGVKVIVPITAQLEALFEKYDWKAPDISDQKSNKYIKDIAKKLEFDDPIEIEKTKSGRRVKEYYPKYDLIKNHSARRSSCTNMKNAKVPTVDILRISGHSTEAQLFAYIKTTKLEAAERMSEHSFFNKPITTPSK